MRGNGILIGGTPAGVELTADHLSILWGKSIVGMLGSAARSHRLITTLGKLHAAGRCPFDEFVEFFPVDHNQDPIEASYSGAVIKPISTMPT